MYKIQCKLRVAIRCNSGAGARKFPEACEGALYESELTHDASKVIDQSTTPPSSSSALRAPSLKNFSDNFLDYFCLTCIFSGASEGRSCREQSQVNCETSISLVEKERTQKLNMVEIIGFFYMKRFPGTTFLQQRENQIRGKI